MTDTHKTMIVYAVAVEDARSLAANWPGGVGMWQRECCPADGPATAPATAYISSGKIDTGVATALESGAAAVVAAILFINPEAEVTEQQVQMILDNADISDESAEAAMARLNLQYVAKDIA